MGSSSITGDETIGFFDNLSFDGTPRGGKMTTNGQLWIGSTAAPHVRVGTLTSSDGSVTITPGAGTINLASPYSELILSCVEIDFVAVGAAVIPLFTNTNPVAITSIAFVSIDITNFSLGWSADFGWTPVLYDDYATGIAVNLNQTGQVDNYFNPFTNPSILVPAGVTFSINITNPDVTSTTNVTRIYIMGIPIV